MKKQVLVPLFLTWSGFAFAACLQEDVLPNQYLVRLKNTVSVNAASSFESFMTSRNIRFERIFHEPRVLLSVKGASAKDVAALRSHVNVETVEHDCRVHLFQQPNDPQFSKQWGLDKINAVGGWDISTGSTQVIVAISDTGVDYLHEDLKDNMWTNTNEIPNNGIDDDKNGCIDDIHGCDLAENTGDPMPPSNNQNGMYHGTHVAGIAGAVGNNGVGVSGVSQKVRIMAAKGFSNNGSGQLSALLKTIYYSVDNGAKVINCSWGRQGSPTQAEIDAFKYAHDKGVVVTVAAGNSNADTAGFSPASVPTVIAVAATDKADALATFSNWGTRVDVAAPGGHGYDLTGNMVDGILSTFPRSYGNYGELMGTSMAAPFVAGLSALVFSVNSSLTPDAVLKILKDSGDTITVPANQNHGEFKYPRINVFKALKLAQQGTGPTPTPTPSAAPSPTASPHPSASPTPPPPPTSCGTTGRPQAPLNLAALLLLLGPLAFGVTLRRFSQQN